MGYLNFPESSAAGGGHTIADGGADAAARGTLNFDGTHFGVTDDAGNDETDVALTGDFAALNLISTGYMRLGTTPATVATGGQIGVPNLGGLFGMNGAGTQNAQLVTIDATNTIIVGGDANSAAVSLRPGGTGSRLNVTTSALDFSVNTVRWALGFTPAFHQTALSTNSATGATMTINAQNCTGTTSTGGALDMRSGTGTSADGEISLSTGTTKRFRANATGISFFGVAPVARPAAYTPTNVTPDRSYDADTVLVAELADVLGTVIADLQALGILQ